MNTNKTQRRTGWFLVLVAACLLILAMVPGNDLAFGAAVSSGLFGAAGYIHLQGARR